MRTYNSIKNMIFAVLSNALTIVIGFVVQKVFLDVLGTEYLGLNSLYTNIVSMLAIADLGIGTAIIYNLYEPIAKNNKERIKSLMKFYKKTYQVIALVIFVIGLILIPFLNILVGKTTIPNTELIFIFLLFLLDTVCSYLLSYKRSLLYADQKIYITSIIHLIYLLVMNSLLLVCLFTTGNYYIFLIIKIIMRILENVVIYIITDKKYKYLKEKDVKKLPDKIVKDVFTKVKGLIFHKIGSFIVLGTDNILISIFLGVSVVGKYNNYYMVIYALSTLIGQGFTSFTASIGNLLTLESEKRIYNVYKRINLLNFWVATYTSVSVLVVAQSFISAWYGSEYLLEFFVLAAIVLNYYLTVTRYKISIFKEAAGIFHEDRFIPIFESILNIVSSLIFLKFCGLAGVFIGTIISNLLLHLYSYPKYVFNRLFKVSNSEYYKSFITNLLLFIFISVVTYFATTFIKLNNDLLQMILNIIISLIIPNLILLLVFFRTKEFKYYIDLIRKVLKKKIKKEA